MIQTIDIAHAEEPELQRWMAELPCPCPGHKLYMNHSPCLDIEAGEGKLLCDGNGLALPWASTKCLRCGGSGELDRGPNPEHCEWCSRSGRVPKAVGLEELYDHGITVVGTHPTKGFWAEVGFPQHSGHHPVSYGETPLLAALRAYCASVMR